MALNEQSGGDQSPQMFVQNFMAIHLMVSNRLKWWTKLASNRKPAIAIHKSHAASIAKNEHPAIIYFLQTKHFFLQKSKFDGSLNTQNLLPYNRNTRTENRV